MHLRGHQQVRLTWHAVIEVRVQVAAEEQCGCAAQLSGCCLGQGMCLRQHGSHMERPDVRCLGMKEQVGVNQAQWAILAPWLAGDWLQNCQLRDSGHLQRATSKARASLSREPQYSLIYHQHEALQAICLILLRLQSQACATGTLISLMHANAQSRGRTLTLLSACTSTGELCRSGRNWECRDWAEGSARMSAKSLFMLNSFTATAL